jgi:hypothetical protein
VESSGNASELCTGGSGSRIAGALESPRSFGSQGPRRIEKGRQLSDRTRWSQAADLVGTAAVVVSLIYVGLQVRQNTAAIQTSTSQDVYEQYQEQALLVMESAEMAEIVLRADRSPAEMSAVDSLRYDRYLNVTINLYEAIYTNALQGTMEQDLAAGWLAGMGTLQCRAGMPEYWTRLKGSYHAAFREAMDSAYTTARCPE